MKTKVERTEKGLTLWIEPEDGAGFYHCFTRKNPLDFLRLTRETCSEQVVWEVKNQVFNASN